MNALFRIPFRILKKLLRSRVLAGILIGVLLVIGIGAADRYTATNEFCESCHVHPQATSTWRRSTHFDNQSGVIVRCVECHLPPGGFAYYSEKARTGLRDLWGHLFKDPERFDWEAKSRLDHARDFTYKASCERCHQNLFTIGMSEKGDEAHLHYSEHPDELRCLNCHLHVGHYTDQAAEATALAVEEESEREIFAAATRVEGFESFMEQIPGSTVAFDMIAIPGGTFTLGSPDSEPLRNADESPTRSVRISPFWMGKTEVTWDEYGVFYRQTAAEGRSDTRALSEELASKVDAITGATPPYGNPDQGWGKGQRPAITMTHHAATTYCRWLSQVTGKTYRLPTEAEWEYACRGGTEGPYFFEGSPKDFTERTLWNRIFGADTEGISPYVIYAGNSGGKTHPPSASEPNPLGLLNMSGNVSEFCLDWYSPKAYAGYPGGETVTDPVGPAEGEEHVIRGGCFKSDAAEVRSAARDHTRHDAWMLTDPQIPKSKWWYSDSYTVGFRVVCEYHPEE